MSTIDSAVPTCVRRNRGVIPVYLEEHEKATLDEVALLVSNLQSLANPTDHASALAILRKVEWRS